MIGYASATLLERDRPNNLLSMTAALVSQTAPQLEAPSRTVAGEFILDQLGRRARIPVIGEALFRGAGIVRLATSDRAPALYYDDLAHGSKLVVTIYDYETIERLEQTTELPADLLKALERENELFVSTTPRGAVAAWRHRADVYVASGTSDSVRSLDNRVTFAGDDID
jgi:hypothetical protein